MDFDLGGNAMDMNFEFNVADAPDNQRLSMTPTTARRAAGTPRSKRVCVSILAYGKLPDPAC